MKVVDGSMGEGGGQILRTVLALSLITGTPVRIENVRARRGRPGLRAQHLAAVRAAARVGAARVEGAEIGSTRLVFEPGPVAGGTFEIDIGTAGSTTLVLQTLLLALLRADAPTTLVLVGGTHNPMAPSFDFIERAYLPVLRRMGADVAVHLERPGFYPRGGGIVRATIQPTRTLRPIEIMDRGTLRSRLVRAVVAQLPPHIAVREIGVLRKILGWPGDLYRTETERRSVGPGNYVSIEIECEHVTEVITGYGERGVPAERVAEGAAREARRYLDSGVPVGEHLADQLLLPLALAGGGGFRTLPLSSHARTQMQVIPMFIEVPVEGRPVGDAVEVRVG